jgi:hypothetical protein
MDNLQILMKIKIYRMKKDCLLSLLKHFKNSKIFFNYNKLKLKQLSSQQDRKLISIFGIAAYSKALINILTTRDHMGSPENLMTGYLKERNQGA